MKIIAFTILASLGLAGTAESILPPLYEGISEIKAIVTDPQISQKFHSGEVILSIQKNEKGYEIVTNQHRVQVNVIYKPVERPGPAHYDLEFEDPIAVPTAK